jgi:putative ABC transport system permease protein
VSAINVGDVLATIRDVVRNVTMGVTVVGLVTVLSGVLILVGAVVMTKFQRLYDAAIYRTLGASTRLVAAMVAVEYAVLGALAGGLGAAGALGLSWGLSRYLFDIPWTPAPLMLSIGWVAAAGMVGAVGVGSSLDVLLRKPLATLRGE